MKQDRYQFFELTRHDPRFKSWERQVLLDRVSGTVYLPAVDPEVMLLGLEKRLRTAA